MSGRANNVPPKKAEELFYLDGSGTMQDAELHDAILERGDHEAALVSGKQIMMHHGLTTDRIDALLYISGKKPDPNDPRMVAIRERHRAKALGERARGRVKARYSEDQPRDENGQWTDGGGSEGSAGSSSSSGGSSAGSQKPAGGGKSAGSGDSKGSSSNGWLPADKYRNVPGESQEQRLARIDSEHRAAAQASIDAGAYKHPMLRGESIGVWGGSHAGSYDITGWSASQMGVDGYTKQDHDHQDERLATKFLQAVSDSPGSSEPLYHGFEDVEGIKWKSGDTVKLPLLASTGDAEDAAGYGVTGKDQTTTPTVFAFPKGTAMAGYARWSKTNPDGTAFDFGHVWSEAIVAGEFKVGRIGEVRGRAWWNPKITVVELIPQRVFDPKTAKWKAAT
jgi:hypothetical protein